MLKGFRAYAPPCTSPKRCRTPVLDREGRHRARRRSPRPRSRARRRGSRPRRGELGPDVRHPRSCRSRSPSPRTRPCRRARRSPRWRASRPAPRTRRRARARSAGARGPATGKRATASPSPIATTSKPSTPSRQSSSATAYSRPDVGHPYRQMITSSDGSLGEQRGDVRGAALERGALVDVALVGDLVGVQRRRLGEQDHALDARRGRRVLAVVGDEALAHELGQLRRAHEVRRLGVRLAGDLLRRAHVRPREQPDVVAVVAADDGVHQQRRGGGERRDPQVADGHERAGQQLEVLDHAAVEHEPLVRVVRRPRACPASPVRYQPSSSNALRVCSASPR